jgi:signal transduction histidine kinase
MNVRQTIAEIIPQAFPGITSEEAGELATRGRMQSHPAGTILCHENEYEHTFYLLLEGTVDVTKIINNVEKRHLKILEEGAFFGEMAIIHNAPRGATVTARTDVTVMEISKDDFNRALHNSGSVSLAMVREISARLRENDTMAIEDLRLRAGELARAYQQLAEQEMARREFLTNIAHELRTPLMAAGGYLQLLQKNMVPAAEMPNIIETVARNVQQINSLVNDILFLQEMDLILPKFQAVDLRTIVKAVADKYRAKAQEKNIQFSVELPDSLPMISGDPKSLERALTALVDNAIKFTDAGKKVGVLVSLEHGQAVVRIADEGIGISDAVKPRLFDRFYHLERSGEQLYSGIGLGLAITRQVIEQHKGKLELESEAGKGTTAIIRLDILRVAL